MAVFRNILSKYPSSLQAVTSKSSSVRLCHHGSDKLKLRPAPSQTQTLMDIGTRPLFSEEHDAFRETARKFFQKEVAPKMPEWEKTGCSDRETWLAAGEYGILGVATPAEVGGIGGSYLHAAIAMEEQSYINCSGPAFSLHSDIVMPYIYKYGSKEQIERLIPDLVSGKKISAIAMTEPEAGSDLQGIRTFAKKDGDDYILNGSKVYITNGWNADVVVVVAVTNREAKSPAHGISLFLVEEGMPGFKKGWLMKKMGLHCSDTAGLFFEDVRLPASALLGEENKGFYYLMNELPQERLNIGVHGIAHCEWAFEETRNFVMQRKAFGKTIAQLQTIQHKLAELKTDIAVGRAFIDQCIALHCNQQLDGGMASMAKYWVSDLENSVAYRCVQMHGGAGYLWDTPIAKMYVDARVQPIYGGSNEIMKELIARQIVGGGKKK